MQVAAAALRPQGKPGITPSRVCSQDLWRCAGGCRRGVKPPPSPSLQRFAFRWRQLHAGRSCVEMGVLLLGDMPGGCVPSCHLGSTAARSLGAVPCCCLHSGHLCPQSSSFVQLVFVQCRPEAPLTAGFAHTRGQEALSSAPRFPLALVLLLRSPRRRPRPLVLLPHQACSLPAACPPHRAAPGQPRGPSSPRPGSRILQR